MTDTLTDTIEGTEILADLDWEPACEHSQHEKKHPGDEPAKYIVRASCDVCLDNVTYLLCHPGWVYLTERTALYCAECMHCDPDDVRLKILETLR